MNFDIIVVATPIEISAEILLELSKNKPEGLIFDIGSLKTPLRDGLKSLLNNGCMVTSLHPMFGPEDVVIESDVNILDVAALSLIIEESGGVFTDFQGESPNLDTTSVIASNPNLYSSIKKELIGN